LFKPLAISRYSLSSEPDPTTASLFSHCLVAAAQNSESTV
jgi:hypothetical protein